MHRGVLAFAMRGKWFFHAWQMLEDRGLQPTTLSHQQLAGGAVGLADDVETSAGCGEKAAVGGVES